MKVQIGRDYIVIDGLLYDFTSYKDMNIYALLSVINTVDDSRYPDEASERMDKEVIADEEFFQTPYGYTILQILYAYYNFTDLKALGEEYNQLTEIRRNINKKFQKKCHMQYE